MSIERTVKQLQEEAIAIAKNRVIDTDSDDYHAGYVKGVHSMAQLVLLARHSVNYMAQEATSDPILKGILEGYADTLDILLDAADKIIPPEYEMGE